MVCSGLLATPDFYFLLTRLGNSNPAFVASHSCTATILFSYYLSLTDFTDSHRNQSVKIREIQLPLSLQS